jgi:hypothetical protein
MKVETSKKLILTKEEVNIIAQFYDILDNDKDLDLTDAWEIFTAVRDIDNSRAKDYDYTIIITN